MPTSICTISITSSLAYQREDSHRYRRPIVCNVYRDPIEIFDRHLYQKGAAVLHMLRGELGDARFWRSIARYANDNAQRSVETIDLVRAIEAATGRNLRGFFDQWVYREGYPVLNVGVSWDAQRRVATLTIDQEQAIDDEHPPYNFDVEIGFAPDASARGGAGAREPLAGERRVRAHVERRHETVAVHLDFEPKLVRFDPGSSLLAEVRYRIGADFAAAALRADPDVIARIRAARELARDGGRVAREAIEQAFARRTVLGRARGDRFGGRRYARAVGVDAADRGAEAPAPKSRSRGRDRAGKLPRAARRKCADRDGARASFVFRSRVRAGVARAYARSASVRRARRCGQGDDVERNG